MNKRAICDFLMGQYGTILVTCLLIGGIYFVPVLVLFLSGFIALPNFFLLWFGLTAFTPLVCIAITIITFWFVVMLDWVLDFIVQFFR